MRRKCLIPALALLVATSLALPVLAQRTSASIRAVVEGPEGPLPGVTVTVQSDQTGFTRTQYSNPQGIVVFGDLPVGSYDVVARLDGFREVTVNEVTLNVADVRNLQITLPVGAVEDEITVAASAVVVETIGGEVAGLVTGATRPCGTSRRGRTSRT